MLSISANQRITRGNDGQFDHSDERKQRINQENDYWSFTLPFSLLAFSHKRRRQAMRHLS